MKSPAKLTFESVLVIAAGIALAIAPFATEAGHRPDTPPVFGEFDSNADGTLSEEEFEAGRAARHAAMAEQGCPMKGMSDAPAFADFDTDDDGQLSQAEFSAGHDRRMQSMRGKHHGHGGHGDHGTKRSHRSFDAIDRNGDGCIDRSELDAHHAEGATN